ncbi:MAG: Stp1/IreP family PP2C-type Ser/Thr phosphatase [Parachlamydiales bacterium]
MSHKGLVRQNNEDVWEIVSSSRFYVVADGMGGHQAGEVAAREAVRTLCRVIEEKKHQYGSSMSGIRRELRHGIELANYHVYKMGKNNPDLKGMGTTLCCIYINENGIIYGNVGDSRIYRFRDGALEQLTRDDSLLRELLDQGQLAEYQSSDFLYKNIITKAIGAEPSVEPNVHSADIQEGDFYLMCTDGLTDMLTDESIAQIIAHMKTPEEGVEQLINEAISHGGYDNITVVMLAVQKEDER